jgi:glyoxylase-like metal-dependent hydrolase (beta-lactamase superfamily II)
MNEHNDISDDKAITLLKEDPYKVTSEFLDKSGTELTCFFFRLGANFYVFSYDSEGLRKHTFIDTGDRMYRDRMLSILKKHRINPSHIERIIITHRHNDHCGLADLLAGESGAEILVHSNFRDFIEGKFSEAERVWLRGFEPSLLRQYNIRYLSPSGDYPSPNIDGLAFPGLTEPISLGRSGRLHILACPESDTMHSPDQILVRYTRPGPENINESAPAKGRLVNDILFSGDLWLMHGPLFTESFRELTRRLNFASRHLKGILKGHKHIRRDPRLQDVRAKDALKRGFSLIRVMPGHGEDFIGTRIIPAGFLADRDLLVELGYDMDEKKSLLRAPHLKQKVKDLREKAYTAFIKELRLWAQLGYSSDDIPGLLARIYKEQEGGGPLVREDRKERRQRIEETLARLKNDNNVSADLKTMAESTLLKLETII